MQKLWDLSALINAADARASRAERQLWLVRMLEWLRHPPQRAHHGQPHEAPPPDAVETAAAAATSATSASSASATAGAVAADTSSPSPWPVRRLKLLLHQLEQNPAWREQVQGLLSAFWRDIDAPALFADLGFGARRSFASELLARVHLRVLPGTPDTRDLAALFHLLFEPADRSWLAAIDRATWQRLAVLVSPGDAAARALMLDAVTILASAMQAAGYSPLLRQRMAPELLRAEPFRQLSQAAQNVRQATLEGRAQDALREAAYLRALLDHCRQAAQSVLPHLEEFGVSVNIVFDLDQVLARADRIELLLGAVLAPDNSAENQHLLLELVDTLQEARGVRALFARHYSLLARQVTERSAETGEHYIANNRAQWLQMLRRAAGGGVVIAGTTLVKFWLGAFVLSAFWAGLRPGSTTPAALC